MEMGMGEQCKDRWHTVAGSVDRAEHCPGCGMSRVYWEHSGAPGTMSGYENAILEAYDRGYVDGMKPGAVAPSATKPLEVPEDLG